MAYVAESDQQTEDSGGTGFYGIAVGRLLHFNFLRDVHIQTPIVCIGRAWQIGFFAGLVIRSLLVLRALWPTGAKLALVARQFWSGRIGFEHLLWAFTANIALLYAFGMMPLRRSTTPPPCACRATSSSRPAPC